MHCSTAIHLVLDKLIWFSAEIGKPKHSIVGYRGTRKNSGSHIDASHSRQPFFAFKVTTSFEGGRVTTFPLESTQNPLENY